jgi:surfactin synthase thioesterase subunit
MCLFACNTEYMHIRLLTLSVVCHYTTIMHDQIISEVAKTMNKCWATLQRIQPDLTGSCIGIVGHSLGSVIAYDLLQGQTSNECVDLGPTSCGMTIPVPRQVLCADHICI